MAEIVLDDLGQPDRGIGDLRRGSGASGDIYPGYVSPVFRPASRCRHQKQRKCRQNGGHVPRGHVPLRDPRPHDPSEYRSLWRAHAQAFPPAREISGRPVRAFGADVDLGAEDPADVVGRDRGERISLGRHGPVLQEDETAGEGRGQVDVVLGRDDGLALSGLERFEDAVDLGLVADVEVEARLVEEEQRRILGQGPGDERPLALAAAQLGELLAGDRRGLGQAQGLFDRRPVLGRNALQPAPAGEPAHEHDLADGVFEDRFGQLGDVGDPGRDPARAQAEDVLAAAPDLAPDVRQEVLDGLEERALAGAVPAEDGDELPGLDGERDAVNDVAVLVSRREARHFENAHVLPFSPSVYPFIRGNSTPGKADLSPGFRGSRRGASTSSGPSWRGRL